MPDVINCNLKKGDPIFIIFGNNTNDTTGHQMTINFFVSPNICFCTTWEKQNKRNIRWNEHKTSKNIPDIIGCNLKKDYQVLIIFGMNISDVTGR